MNKKEKKSLIVVVVILLGAYLYYRWHKNKYGVQDSNDNGSGTGGNGTDTTKTCKSGYHLVDNHCEKNDVEIIKDHIPSDSVKDSIYAIPDVNTTNYSDVSPFLKSKGDNFKQL